MTDISDEAVEAVETVLTDAGVDLYDNVHDLARLVTRAAAPLIAAQATKEMRAGIEALRDEFRSEIDWSDGRSNYGDNAAWERAANALDALLRGAK